LKHLGLTLLSFSLLAATPAFADSIPYPHTGTIPAQTTLIASSTGTVTGYFYSESAADYDEVRLLDVTQGTSSIWELPNQTTSQGTSTSFAPVSVNAGDTLVFELLNTSLNPNQIFATTAANSSDGVNHGYVTAFSGGSGIPAGLYVGFEDLPKSGSDLDYNDETIVVTNVSAAPEPSSLALLGTGILGVAAGLRRKFKLS
jgi:hypothetical protein